MKFKVGDVVVISRCRSLHKRCGTGCVKMNFPERSIIKRIDVLDKDSKHLHNWYSGDTKNPHISIIIDSPDDFKNIIEYIFPEEIIRKV